MAIVLIATRNELGKTIKSYNIDGPGSYAQATGQVIKVKDLQMKTVEAARIVGNMITNSTGAVYAVATAWVKGKVGSNQGAGGGGGSQDIEVHFNTLGSTEIADLTDLSGKSYRLEVEGT